ncbi:unnamed protein product [Allacma fusca]|uniref:MACPF domain-containing protein n=1 Tax=Allacma fusca TaxID=39272 RepID=A0A8J2PAQ5_9HEXA|nr:unnamed protein product [Allacma fusca]
MKLDLDETCPLNPEFERMVQELPKSFSKCQRGLWQEFINTVGTHYVSTGYIGASVVFEIKNLNPDAVHRLDESSYSMDSFLNYLLVLPRVLPTNREDSHLNLIFVGGDPIRGEELQNSRNKFEFFPRLKRWEYSIWDNPIVSDMHVGLSEVADLVTTIDARTGKALRAAVKDLRQIQDGVICNRCAIE